MDKKYTQQEFLEIMQEYNNMDRKVIKHNLNIMKDKIRLRNIDIATKLESKVNKVAGWFNESNPTIPTFIDALQFCITFEFSIEEAIQKEVKDTKESENNFIYSL